MWKLYKIVFRLRSPLHVGYIKIGNLMRTRLYVAGKTMWGSVTAALAVTQWNGDFPKAQQQTKDTLAFSYFYPALDYERPLWPDYTDKGLCYGQDQMPAAEFERRFVGAYASTALDYSSNTAQDGSLHEVEFISPYDQVDGKPVYLVGYIFERDGSSLKWLEILPHIRVGGERKYGWGQVSLVETCCNSSKLFGLTVDLGEKRPMVRVQEGQPLLAHAVASKVQARGQIEPLIGRETHSSEGWGETFSQCVLCWAPGSRLHTEQILEIGEYGIWQ